MAVAVAVAAKPAAEAPQQHNNQDDDEYRSKCHGDPPTRSRRLEIHRRSGEETISAIRVQRSGPTALFRLELQRRRVDAVAQPGRAGTVRKDVSEMAVTFRAQHFGADHAVGVVVLLVDMALGRRGGEAWPSAAGTKLGI